MKRTLSLLAVSLLAAFLSGVPSAMGVAFERVDGCGESCRRCWCKQHAGEMHMRAPCPCCSRNTAPPGAPVETEPAIVARLSVTIILTATPGEQPQYVVPASAYAPSIPHPPPRQTVD